MRPACPVRKIHIAAGTGERFSVARQPGAASAAGHHFHMLYPASVLPAEPTYPRILRKNTAQ